MMAFVPVALACEKSWSFERILLSRGRSKTEGKSNGRGIADVVASA
jgi:hypothetical protein